MIRSVSRPHWWLVVLSFIQGGCETVSSEAFRYPEGRFGGGELRYINELPVLTVRGTPAEIGVQTAELALKPAERVTRYPREALSFFCVPWLEGPMLAKGEALLPAFPEDYRRELAAQTAAAPHLRDQLVMANTLFDIKKMAGCSSFIVEPSRSEAREPMLGRNLDFLTLGYLQDYSLVTVCKPASKLAFVSVGFPGMVGCLSGMNEAGLALTMHEVYQAKVGLGGNFNPAGVPYALCYRRALEECRTTDEAIALLQSLPHTTSNNVALCDAAGHSAIVEISPKQVAVRRTAGGVNSCTNHFRSRQQAVWWQFNLFGTVTRAQELDRWEEKPTLSRADVAAALHDVNKGSHTLQTMIFEPRSLRLHLAIGPCPTTMLPLRTLDLAPLFARP